jgi:hypothetical protein
MRKLLLINALLSTLFCFAQPANQKSNTEQEIRKLMQDWMIAMMKRDEKTLNKIVASEYKLDGTYPFDKPPVSRETWMTNTMHNLKVDSVHYYDIKIDVIDNVAIVQSRFYWAGKFGDRPPFVDSTSILVDTWMKRSQGWQVVSRLRVDKPE